MNAWLVFLGEWHSERRRGRAPPLCWLGLRGTSGPRGQRKAEAGLEKGPGWWGIQMHIYRKGGRNSWGFNL